MITLTADNGAAFQIDGASVIRIRRVVAVEAPIAKTRIDWVTLKFAREEPADVAGLVKAENPKLAQLPGPDGSPVWFDCRLAKGPVWFDHNTANPGTKSAFELANKIQFVSVSPEDVQTTMKDSGGTPLPIPTSNLLTSLKGIFKSIVGDSKAPAVWD